MQDIQEYNLRGGYVRIPNYGNWCGPGYGGGTPIDQVDSFCRTHDYCYGSSNSLSEKCQCDRELVDSITCNWKRYSGKERAAAIGIVGYFNSAAAGCRECFFKT